ncbi:MAG: hypothetical protein U0T73_10780 [Chitinophagales bacterium]
MITTLSLLQSVQAFPIKAVLYWRAQYSETRFLQCDDGSGFCLGLESAARNVIVDFPKIDIGTILIPENLWKEGASMMKDGRLILPKDFQIRPDVVRAITGSDQKVAVVAGSYLPKLTPEGYLLTVTLKNIK